MLYTTKNCQYHALQRNNNKIYAFARTQVCALTIQFDADINILVLVQAKLLFQYLSNTVSNKNQWDKFIDAHVNNWSFKTKTETLATPQLQKQQFTSLA